MQPDDQWRPPQDGSAAGAGGTPAEQQGLSYGQGPHGQGSQGSYGQGGSYGQQHGYGQQAGYAPPQQSTYGGAPEYPVYPGGQPTGYGGPTQGYTVPGYDPYAGGYGGFAPYGTYQQRPSGATVITAAVIQIVQGAIGVLAGLLIAFAGDFISENANELDDRGIDTESAQAVSSAIIAVGVVVLLISAFLIVLAALTMQRHRWALITSVVLQGIWVLLSIVGIASANRVSGGTVIGILIAAAVVVLLLLPSSSQYIASRQASWPQQHR
jgi:hypothetical protein